MFPLAAFLTQIIIFINQQNDGHGVGQVSKSKRRGKKNQNQPDYDITVLAVKSGKGEPQNPSFQIFMREGINLQKQPGEKLKVYKGGNYYLLLDIFDESDMVVLF